ncbi:MAG: BrnA antitoxin family protein [Terrimicrobiaceae bacterium]
MSYITNIYRSSPLRRLIPEAFGADWRRWKNTEMPEWTADDFARAKPASEVLPRGLFESAVSRRRGQRGPQKAPVKKAITLRIDPDIIARYKAMGPGWQSRMNEALRRSIETA